MRDSKGRFIKATQEQFTIDEAGRQLARDTAQQVLAESSKELAKESTVTPGGFPESPQKRSKGKASAAPPDNDPSSSDSSSESDRMSEEAGPADPIEEPRPDPGTTAKLSIKVPTPKKFTGEGEDLKPEAFDRWYNAVQLYLRLHGVRQSIDGSGNYWILYTDGRAQEAAFQAAELFGEDITRDQLVVYLRERFQSSKQKDDTYDKFHEIRQVKNSQTERISIISTDLLMHRSRLPRGTISDYAFIQHFLKSIHRKQ